MKLRRASLVAMLSTFLVLILACGQGQPPGRATPTVGSTGGTPARQLSLERGESVYQANCLVCHGDRSGEGGNGLGPPHNEQGHTWHHPDAQLTEWTLNGRLYGGMPAFKDKLSEQDVEAVLAFFKTWWTEEQRQSQADVSRRYEEALDKQKRGQ